MLTNTLVNLANKAFPDWGTPQIFGLLNEVQNIIFLQKPTSAMRVLDPTTGKDPILTTVAGQYVYLIDTTSGFPSSYNIWRITDIRKYCNYCVDLGYWPKDVWGDYGYGGRYSHRKEFLEGVKFYDKTPQSSAKIVFESDPGVEQYYLRMYRYPVEITTMSTPLEVPEGFHLSHVFEGLCGLIEMYRSGSSQRWEKFQTKLLPDLISKMNDGNHVNYKTPYRPA